MNIVFGCALVTSALFAQVAPGPAVDYAAITQEERDLRDPIMKAQQEKRPAEDIEAIGRKGAAVMRAKADAASGELRQAYLVAELVVAATAKPAFALATALMKEVLPTSPAWQVEPGMLPYLGNVLGEGSEAYRKAMEEQGVKEVRSVFRMEAVFALAEARRFQEARAMLVKVKEEFKGNPELARLEAQVQAMDEEDAPTRLGQPAPAFSVPNVDNAKVNLTNADFKGKFLLLDFWGTWCGPCKAEVPGMQLAYAHFKDKGLEILSISCDHKPESVVAFRNKAATPMPWHHGFGGYPFGKDMGGTASEAANANAIYKNYHVYSFPNLFLLDREGRVVAKGNELRGGGLEKTLAKLLVQ